MNITKLPSGSYRIRHMVDGKSYSVTVKEKPSKTEAMKLITAKIDKPIIASDMTFKMACDAYFDAKANVLSPKTLAEYIGTARRLPEAFTKKRLVSITSLDVQKVINDYAARLSPKTVKNYSIFIMAVLRAQDMNIKSPKLPQEVKCDLYIPTKSDLDAIFDVINGTEHEVAIKLCGYGLRRSEVCALTIDDIVGVNVSITKAMVKDKDNNWVIKTTKTVDSTRVVEISPELADKIRQQGYIYKYNPDNIYKALQRAQKKAGVHPFRLHTLRHFFASYLHHKGFPNKQIQDLGGWKTDSVMKKVYQHAINMDAARKKAAQDLSKIFS